MCVFCYINTKMTCNCGTTAVTENKYFFSLFFSANKNFFNYDLNYFEPIQFAKYKKDDFYDWHQDFQTPKDGECRKLSLTFALSDASTYEGGYLEFFNGWREGEGYSEVFLDGKLFHPKEVKDLVRKQGSVIVFDSRDYHRVSPITRGTRYSLVCWTQGANFK